MSHQGKVSEKEQEMQFKRILKLPPNALCAECSICAPSWSSIDFGVFICLNCAGAHRALGPSVTRVRSTRLDGWTQEQIDILDNIGNKTANEYWEHKLQPERKPDSNMNLDDMIKFVSQKYVKKVWVQEGVADPKTRYAKCLIQGIPFKTHPKCQMILPPRPKQIPHIPKQQQKKQIEDQDNTKAFYSHNGSGEQFNWKKRDASPQCNSIARPSSNQFQMDTDLLSPTRKPTNVISFEDESIKQFRTTPVGVENWMSPQPKLNNHAQSLQIPQQSWSQAEWGTTNNFNSVSAEPQLWSSSSSQAPIQKTDTNNHPSLQWSNSVQQPTTQQFDSFNNLHGLKQQSSNQEQARKSPPYVNQNERVQQVQISLQSQQILQPQYSINLLEQYQPQANNPQIQSLPQQGYQIQNQWNQEIQNNHDQQPQKIWNDVNSNQQPQYNQFNTWNGGNVQTNTQFSVQSDGWQVSQNSHNQINQNRSNPSQNQNQNNHDQNVQNAFKNNPFSMNNEPAHSNQATLLNLYSQQPQSQKNYSALRNNPFM